MLSSQLQDKTSKIIVEHYYCNVCRNFRLFVGLLTLDTTASENHTITLQIQAEAQSRKKFEAFLEAAPQFVFQLSIILRTGDYGEFLQRELDWRSLWFGNKNKLVQKDANQELSTKC